MATNTPDPTITPTVTDTPTETSTTTIMHTATNTPAPFEGSYAYDATGNMTQRTEIGVSWTQEFNAENRLVSISDGTDTWEFTYDGDGNRVRQQNPDGSITIFLGGGLYTVEDAAGTPEVTKYYVIAGQRVAMDDGDGFKYLLTDHLGSVVAALDEMGELQAEQRYMPFGTERPIDGGITQTDFGYTGQRSLAGVGLMDYSSRWYDAGLGRFVSADSIVPSAGNSQSLNRYSYVYNNPMGLVDPSGNRACGDEEVINCEGKLNVQTVNPNKGCGIPGLEPCGGVTTTKVTQSYCDLRPESENCNDEIISGRDKHYIYAGGPGGGPKEDEAGPFLDLRQGGVLSARAVQVATGAELIIEAKVWWDSVTFDPEDYAFNTILTVDYLYNMSSNQYSLQSIRVYNASSADFVVSINLDEQTVFTEDIKYYSTQHIPYGRYVVRPGSQILPIQPSPFLDSPVILRLLLWNESFTRGKTYYLGISE